MKVEQIKTLVNTVTEEILGQSDIVSEDLSNVVDVGKQLFDATSVENVTKTLIDHIGRMVFVNRAYKGGAPNVLMESWEFGSVLEKSQCELPEAEENDSWNLVDKQTYNQDIFYQPKVTVKFFNSKTTFEIPMSYTYRQCMSAFDNATQLNSFMSMIASTVEKSLTIKTDSMIMRTINNFIAVTFAKEFPEGTYTGNSKTRAVNVLHLYNTKFGTDLTADKCLTDAGFQKYLSYLMGVTVDRMKVASTLFNLEGKVRHTPLEDLKVVMLSDVAKAGDVYLQADTYHNEMVKLPGYSTVPYWQGSGENYDFGSISEIHVVANTGEAEGKEITATGILGVMFDREALAVCNYNRRTTQHVNEKAEFTNNWAKVDCSYFNDFQENFVVFYAA